ncbi:MAG: DUF4340 domain-containing protein [bacterium]|nr:DUF4340 domain-containing protein [bacterium]
MNRKTLVLGGVLIALIALAFLYQGPLKKWQNSLGKPSNFLAKIDLAKIDKIEVISGSNTVVLNKQGGLSAGLAQATSAGSVETKWKYNNSKDFYVDPAIMAKVLESLDKAKTSELELVSNNPERKSEFKIDSAGLTVRVYQADKKVADFIIGGVASGEYGSSYISTPESRATYLVRVDFIGAFRRTEWRDLTIFSTAQEKLNKIRFQYSNREFTVELKDGKWAGILPQKFAVNKEKIEKIAQIMSNLKAVEIPEQTFSKTGLNKHLIIIEAKGEAIDNILMIGENLDGRSYAKRGESDNIYLINKSDRDELDKWIWQLK